MSAIHRVFVGVLLFVALATPLLAQSTPDSIAAQLKDRPLYIRGFWSENTLRFDGNGDLVLPSKRSTFTLNGFSFLSIKHKDGVLTILGQVIGLEFRDGKPERISLPYLERIIKITDPVNGDFGPALDAIFADGIESLAPSLPEYWQKWARKNYPAAYSTAQTGKTAEPDTARVRNVGGAVSPPRLSRSIEAFPTDDAMALRYSGTSRIDLIVESDGRPSHLYIVKPLGLGLDERALAAVQGYSFAPATEGGRPISVEIMIEYKFDN